MPYYDYKCTDCNFIFEVQKGMNDKVDPKCPKCGSVSQRIFSPPRTMRSDESGACSTCASGVCSSCGVSK